MDIEETSVERHRSATWSKKPNRRLHYYLQPVHAPRLRLPFIVQVCRIPTLGCFYFNMLYKSQRWLEYFEIL